LPPDAPPPTKVTKIDRPRPRAKRSRAWLAIPVAISCAGLGAIIATQISTSAAPPAVVATRAPIAAPPVEPIAAPPVSPEPVLVEQDPDVVDEPAKPVRHRGRVDVKRTTTPSPTIGNPESYRVRRLTSSERKRADELDLHDLVVDIARELEPDAYLTRMVCTWQRAIAAQCLYELFSRSLAAKDQQKKCIYASYSNGTLAAAYGLCSTGDQVIAAPRCTPGRVVKKLGDHVTGSVTMTYEGRAWSLWLGTEPQTIEDDC
jgi:hypothetical protein